MFIFPLIYIFSFFYAAVNILKNKVEQIFVFIIFGLPLYITALSIIFMYGFQGWIPILQTFKEISILLALGFVLLEIKKKLQFTLIDKLILFYFAFVLLYALLPIGPYKIGERLIALKNIDFFPLVYFTGRLINSKKIYLNRYFSYICYLAIAAAAVLLFEIIPYEHLQTNTGYADYIYEFLNQEPTGNYGLSWTFEIENGLKRFASFFSTPLEHAAATLVTLSVLTAMATTNTYKLVLNKFIILTFICTLLSISFALSRASFASYFIMLYAYAILTKRKIWLRGFHIFLFSIIVIIGFFALEGNLVDFIISSIDFSNGSSVSHLIEWVEGINAIITNPFGLGLGASGRVSAAIGTNVGGENQFIIIGVQAGIIAMLLYIIIYGVLISLSAKIFKESRGKARKLAVTLFLLKIGLIIPLLTSETESYTYISYITWFLTGLLININVQENENRSRYERPAIS